MEAARSSEAVVSNHHTAWHHNPGKPVDYIRKKVKYYALRTYPMLNEAPRHEDVLGSVGTAPHILDFATTWT